MNPFRLLFLAISITIAAALGAVNYCATSAFGYGHSATGGGTATPVLVKNSGELEALSGSKNKVAVITQSFKVSKMVSLQDMSNITIMALPGVTLSSDKQDAKNSGILYIKNSSNIIIRNITFVGPGAYDCDGNDLLCFDGVTKAWVDHCDFADGCDGNFDNKGKTDNVTVSWCKFHYDKAPKAGGPGGADDHRFTNLLGSGSSDKPADGTYNFTWAYCWWGEGCKQRMVRCRNASLHFLNCYWNSSVSDYCIGPENADAYVEGCYFDVNLEAKKIFYQNYNGTNGVKYVSSYAKKGGLSDISNRTVLTPSYSYTALTYAEAKEAVTSATCGAGATLTVTTDGKISSPCDSGEEEKPDPKPVITSDLTWNFSTSEFNSLGNITSNTTVNGLTIHASSSKSMTIAESEKEISGVKFTHVLKTGGSGSEEVRSLSFDVKGDCTIDVYLISANSTSDRTLNIYTGSYSGTPVATLPALGASAAKEQYQYQGPATTIYLGSANSGINIYAINLTYPAATGTSRIDYLPQASKYIKDGQIYILRDGKTYSITGTLIR